MRIPALCVASLFLFSIGCSTPEERAAARAERDQRKAEERAEKERKKQEEQEQKRAEADAAMHAKLPANSLFQPIRVGWSEGEVLTALGEPTTKDSRLTGREYVPFNFGGRGSVRTTWFYKGKGRVVFLGATGGVNNRVVDVEDDPNEVGHFVSK